MTESEAKEKLRAYLKCQRLQVKGIYEDCNENLCDNCDLCYAQGNTGEHIESVKVAIQALEKHIPKKPPVVNTPSIFIKVPLCPNCSTSEHYQPLYGKTKYCSNCGQKLDWSDEE